MLSKNKNAEELFSNERGRDNSRKKENKQTRKWINNLPDKDFRNW